jgi:hypothetical protein
LTRRVSVSDGGRKVAVSTPWCATSIRAGSACSSRTSSSRVARDGTTTRLARRTAVRVAER